MIAQNGKTAIVAASRVEIATALAQRLAAEGFAIVLAPSGVQGDSEACARTIRAVGGRAAAIDADCRRPGAIRALFDAAEAIFAGADVLVSDADIRHLAAPDDAGATLERRVAVNLRDDLRDMREAARRLRAGGRIIMIAGANASEHSARDAGTATRAGITALTRLLAAEMRATRLALNAVALYPKPSDASRAGDDAKEPSAGGALFGELNLPWTLDDLVAFLAGPDGATVDGQVLHVARAAMWHKR